MLLLDVAKGRLKKITILLLAFVNTGFTLNYIYAYMRSEDIDDEACTTLQQWDVKLMKEIMLYTYDPTNPTVKD